MTSLIIRHEHEFELFFLEGLSLVVPAYFKVVTRTADNKHGFLFVTKATHGGKSLGQCMFCNAPALAFTWSGDVRSRDIKHVITLDHVTINIYVLTCKKSN